MSYQVGERDTRPWGTWEVVDVGVGYVVKRIMVLPGKRLSLQRHQHRKESWMVVSGEGFVTCDQLRQTIEPGQTVVIPKKAIHRIENGGPENLVFIEVQFGEHLDENDIERLEDDFGRVIAAQALTT